MQFRVCLYYNGIKLIIPIVLVDLIKNENVISQIFNFLAIFPSARHCNVQFLQNNWPILIILVESSH